jgi:hypothetical protein
MPALVSVVPPPPPTGPPSGSSGVPVPPPPPPPGARPLPLQPMGVGEVLDAAITLYRTQWKALLGIAAILLVPLTFLQLYITRAWGDPFSTAPVTQETLDATLLPFGIVALVQGLFVQPLLTAAVARVAADGYLGHPVDVGTTLRFALRRIHSILWIGILYALTVIVGAILLIVPGVIAYVRMGFGTPALVVEGLKGTKALGRSWRLSKGNFWRLFGVLLLASIMAGIVSSVLTIPTSLAFGAIGPGGWPIEALGQSIAQVLTLPFATLIAVLLYFDLRIRKEAFDLQVMARELAAEP